MNAYLHDKHVSNHAYHIFMLTKYFFLLLLSLFINEYK